MCKCSEVQIMGGKRCKCKLVPGGCYNFDASKYGSQKSYLDHILPPHRNMHPLLVGLKPTMREACDQTSNRPGPDKGEVKPTDDKSQEMMKQARHILNPKHYQWNVIRQPLSPIHAQRCQYLAHTVSTSASNRLLLSAPSQQACKTDLQDTIPG